MRSLSPTYSIGSWFLIVNFMKQHPFIGKEFLIENPISVSRSPCCSIAIIFNRVCMVCPNKSQWMTRHCVSTICSVPPQLCERYRVKLIIPISNDYWHCASEVYQLWKNLLSECKMKGEVFFPFERDGEKSATTKDKYYLELYINEKHILLRK